MSGWTLRGVRVLGPTRASMYSNLQPLFAMAAAWLVLSETPRMLQLAGAACILSGLVIASLRRRRVPVPEPELAG